MNAIDLTDLRNQFQGKRIKTRLKYSSFHLLRYIDFFGILTIITLINFNDTI